MSHVFTTHARRASLAALTSLFLVACGGGGGSDAGAPGDIAAAAGGSGNRSPGKPPGTAPTASPAPAPAGTPAKAPATWVVTDAMQVNTSTGSDQSLRGIGALDAGGYAVAWLTRRDDAPYLSRNTLYVQRYDDAGQPSGGNIPVEFQLPNNADPTRALQESDVTILRDGSVAVLYVARRSVPAPGATVMAVAGLYVKRFDAAGKLLQAQTEIAPERPLTQQAGQLFFLRPTIEPLAYGGFAVAWNEAIASPGYSRDTVYHRRFDEAGMPVGDAIIAGKPSSPDSINFGLQADAYGGYTMTTFRYEFASGRAVSSVDHYPEGEPGRQFGELLGPAGGPLVPLADGSYALFSSGSAGAYFQRLDRDGRPVGTPTWLSTTPWSLPPGVRHELADGGFVAFNYQNVEIAAQLLDATGAPRGGPISVSQPRTSLDSAVLSDGSIALAGVGRNDSAPYQYVFTRRLVEQGGDSTALKAKRKACREAAGGLKGKQRKAAIEACLT